MAIIRFFRKKIVTRDDSGDELNDKIIEIAHLRNGLNLMNVIICDINFYAMDQNGRNAPTPAKNFSCLFDFDGMKYDCRLILINIGNINPGDYKKGVPIKFLCPELIIPKLHKGDNFYLWELKHIAEGNIIEIIKE